MQAQQTQLDEFLDKLQTRLDSYKIKLIRVNSLKNEAQKCIKDINNRIACLKQKFVSFEIQDKQWPEQDHPIVFSTAAKLEQQFDGNALMQELEQAEKLL